MSAGAGPERLVDAARAVGVQDERVLDALRHVPRSEYVPESLREEAYDDRPLPIPHDQVTTQPSLVARMLDALQLRGGERVLEVGTGHGFQTALLARLAGEVWSVDRFDDLVRTAEGNLRRQGVEGVVLRTGDGSAGLPEGAPYDAIVVAAAFPRVPEPLREQLSDGGRLVQPIGPGGAEQVIQFVCEGERLARRAHVAGAHFVRLYGEHGFEPGS